MFHPLSFVIPLLILLPNILFFRMKPNNLPDQNEEKENRVLAVLENVGRIGVFIIPAFSAIHFYTCFDVFSLIGMGISIVIYYAGWVRYFVQGRDYKLLFIPILGIPIPMAISPIVYFVFAAIFLHSLWLFISSVVLAVGHIPISLNTFYQTKNK